MENVLKKLGWKNQPRVAVINAPTEIQAALAACLQDPPNTVLEGPCDFVMYFAVDLTAVERDKAELTGAMAKDGRLWICYPKKTSKKYKSDLSRDILWPLFGEFDYEPVSQYAIDDDWSAMRFRPVDEIKSMSRQRAVSEKGKKRLE